MNLSSLPVSKSMREANPGVFPETLADQLADGKTETKADVSSERSLQRLCEQELSRRNIWFIHLSHRAREKVGCPDIICAVNGIAFACELKTSTGRLTDEQKSTLEHMASNGWRTRVCRSYLEFVAMLNEASIEIRRERSESPVLTG